MTSRVGLVILVVFSPVLAAKLNEGINDFTNLAILLACMVGAVLYLAGSGN
jgi:hypothetical protein